MKSDVCYWKPSIVNHNKEFPFLIVDNWFSEKELSNIWKEIDFLSSRENLERAETNKDVATFDDGTPKAKAFRVFYEELYNDEGKNHSHLPITIKKIRIPEFKKLLVATMPHARGFYGTKRSTTLLTYYEDNDYYAPHFDNAMMTILIWLNKEPKKYEGGDLILTESGAKIKNKNNRMIIFPSYYLHEVQKVTMIEEPEEIGYGRYTITHFFHSE